MAPIAEWSKAPILQGVGSNPTLINLLCISHVIPCGGTFLTYVESVTRQLQDSLPFTLLAFTS